MSDDARPTGESPESDLGDVEGDQPQHGGDTDDDDAGHQVEGHGSGYKTGGGGADDDADDADARDRNHQVEGHGSGY